MAENQKISNLPRATIGSSLSSVPRGILLPIVMNGTNQKLDLRDLIDMISTEIQSNSGSGYTPPSGEQSPTDTTELQNQIIGLASRISTLEDASHWPTNYITLTNGNTSIPYALPSGPGQRGISEGTIVINTNNLEVPDIYVVASVGSPSVSGGIVAASVIGNIYSTHEGLQLKGGTITNISFTGTVYMNNGSIYTVQGSRSLNETLDSSKTSLTDDFVITVVSSSSGISGTVNKIEVQGTVNGKPIPGSATYVVANAGGFAATGYVTL